MKLSNKGSYGIAIEDLPIILHTIVFYVTLIGTGFFQCALGAGLPELSEKMNQSTNSLGILFTARGVGYFIGSVLSTTQVEWKILKLSEPLIVSISALICAIGSIILASVTNFVVLCIIVLVQGAFFAVVEPIAQVYMIEVWGERIEPWLQAFHACFGIGGVLGPVVVGVVGYQNSNIVLTVITLTPSVIYMSQDHIIKCVHAYNQHYANNKAVDFKVVPDSYKLDVAMESADGTKSPSQSQFFLYQSQGGGNGRTEQNTGHTDVAVAVAATLSSGDADIDSELQTIEVEDIQPEGDSTAPRVGGSGRVMPTGPLRFLFFCFYFFYVGLETGYGGWVASFCINMGITDSKANAAYVSSVFFFGLTFGRLLAVPLSVYLVPHVMMKMQLFITIVGAVLFATIGSLTSREYGNALIAAFVFGLGISSIYPIGLTLSQDYHIAMDSRTLITCVFAAICGEAVVPALIGYIMLYTTDTSLVVVIIFLSVILPILYIFIHFEFGRLMIRQAQNSVTDIVLITETNNAIHEHAIEL